VLPAVPQGALEALAVATVLIAPTAAGVLAARRFTCGQALPHTAGPASGFSVWLGKAFAPDWASTDAEAESEAKIRQGVAAALVAGLTGAMLAVLLGTTTIALLPHDSQLLSWLYPHLSRAATVPAEQGAGGNAAGYLLLLLVVPFAGFGVGSVGALIASPDRPYAPGGGGPHGDDPPTVSPPPDGSTDRSPDKCPAHPSVESHGVMVCVRGGT
jgi:hypothetical protein